MPLFVVVVILLIVGSQEKAPVPGKGEERRNDRHTCCLEQTNLHQGEPFSLQVNVATDKPAAVHCTGAELVSQE